MWPDKLATRDAELEQAIQLILDFAVFRGLAWESPGISLSPLNYHFDLSILMRVLLSMVSGHSTSTQRPLNKSQDETSLEKESV